MGAGYKLSASAAESMGLEELLAMEPGASDMLTKFALDYPRRYGPDELREKIAAKYEGIDTDSALITSGVDEGLGLLFVSLVEPGDRVVILTPCYTPHLDLPRWRGATVVPWSAREENDWIPGLDELRSLLRDRTKLVVATFPQNPTGFMPDDDYMAEFINILRDSGALLLSDEIYAGLPIDGAPLPNHACRHERAISLHGLSKTCGLLGLRVGWLVTRDQAAMNAIKESKNLFNAYLPAPIEFLTGLALRHEQELKSRNGDIFATSLKAANSFFKRHDNLFAWSPPEAGVLSFPRWLGPGGTKELSDRLIEEVSIALAPSLCFDAGDNHFRVGLCRRSFPEALERLDDFCTTKL